MKQKEIQRDWTAVRRGNVYCSPACGANCRYEDYLKARVAGEKLARQLGRQWRARVWENMGWYFAAYLKSPGLHRWVTKPHFHVHRFGPRRFWADLNIDHQWHATASTPVAAVRAVARSIRASMAIAQKALDTIPEDV